MIRDILQFFRTEKLYTVLLAIVLLAYGWMAFHHKALKQVPDEEGTTAMASYDRLEERFQKEMEEAGSVEAYFQKHPEGKALFEGFTLIFLLMLGAGLTLDIRFLFKPAFREGLAVDGAFHDSVWSFSLFFKFVILFFLANLGVNLVTAGVDHFLSANWTENVYLLIDTTLVDLLCFGAIYHFVSSRGGTWFDLGFWVPRGNWLREIRVGIGAYLAVLPVFFAILIAAMFVAELFSYRPPGHPLVEIFLEEEKRSPWLVVYSVVLATTVGPLFEEVLFRGFCYPIFKKHFGIPAAMALSAGLFAFIHESSFAFWPIFVLGLVLAYLYEKRKSLVAPVALHMVHNGIFLTYFFLAKSFLMKQTGGGV